MNSNFQKLYNLLLVQKPEKSDAVVWLQGDRYDRGNKVLEIYKSKLARLIVISGNDNLIGPRVRVGENNIGLSDMKEYLIKNGVNKNNIIFDKGALNTKEQAIHIIKLVKQNKWKKIILVSSSYHQPRVFLSFVKALQLIDYKCKIINQSFLSGMEEIASGRTSKNNELMKEESIKIRKYQIIGDVSSYKDGFNYLRTINLVKKNLKFRLATINDADILLKWRNDLKTRKSSHSVHKINTKEHIKWLTASLKDSNRKIFIVEYDGALVGTIRTDNLRDVIELSWTVAPNARGCGIGKEMVAHIANKIAKPIQAVVKVGNNASKQIAMYAGMKLIREENGILYYQRPGSN
jgi:RimJ/RimL family protein N-acetyltransferase